MLERYNDAGSRVGSDASGSETISVVEMGVFLRQHARVLIGAFLLGICAAALFAYLARPTFVAKAQLLIDPKIPQSLRSQTGDALLTLDSAQVETEIAVLRSEKISAAVVADLRLEHNQDFVPASRPQFESAIYTLLSGIGLSADALPEWLRASSPEPSDYERSRRAISSVLAGLDVRRVGTSHTIEIGFAARDPETAARVANAVAQAYVQEQIGARAEAARKGSEWLEEGIHKLRSKMNVAERRVQQIKARRDYRVPKDKLAEVAGLPPSVRGQAPAESDSTIEELESEANSYRTLYESSLQALASSLQRESFPISDARIITPATPPLFKTYPRTTLILVLGALVGAIGGGATALIRHAVDRRVRTPDHMQMDWLECLARIPHLDASWSRSGRKVRLLPISVRRGQPSYQAPSYDYSPFTESLRTLKTLINLNCGRELIKSIGITSSLPGEGKSTIAANLAPLFAAGGLRTLLVDADFRRACLTNHIAPHATGGLLEVLRDGLSAKSLLVQGSEASLSFLPARAKPQAGIPARPVGSADPSDLLGSREMKAWLTEIGQSYDVILVDLPPFTAAADALAVSPLLDGILIVAEWGVTPSDLFAEVSATLRAQANIIGSVLTKVDLSVASPYATNAYYGARVSAGAGPKK